MASRVGVAGDCVAVGIAGVAVGGIGVEVGGAGVAVGGIGVEVGGTGVTVGGIGVEVGGEGVTVGSADVGAAAAVGVGPGCVPPQAALIASTTAEDKTVMIFRMGPELIIDQRKSDRCQTGR